MQHANLRHNEAKSLAYTHFWLSLGMRFYEACKTKKWMFIYFETVHVS